jgi:hypothetical protein
LKKPSAAWSNLGCEGKMKDVFSRVFTLEVDGRPTLSFEARRTREAQEICKESWLRGDLIVLSSGGVPLCSDQSKFTVRPATADEAVVYQEAANIAKPSDDMVLAYLTNWMYEARAPRRWPRRLCYFNPELPRPLRCSSAPAWPLPGAVLFRHLRRKGPGVDAEVNERVHDNSANEHGGEDHQHLQAEATHTGILPAAWLAIKSGESKFQN